MEKFRVLRSMNFNNKSEPIRTVTELDSHLKNPLNRSIIPCQDKKFEERKEKVLLCHDMAGGYHQDALIQGSNDNKPIYSCQYWQYVDIFCYFSHERVTIPPVTWTNACHTNGVRCLGTIIVEWEKGINEILQLIYGPSFNPLLESTQRFFDPHYADILVDLAVYYGFDGYLVNVESSIPSATHCIPLRNFVQYLTIEIHKRLPKSLILWYDSVIYTGSLRWQDQLNDKNSLFFDVSDGMFVNYTWSPPRLLQSAQNAKKRKHDLFTGIDVWGRNTFGGGGFNCHKALRQIKSAQTSIAIFAPAWTFEKLGPDGFSTHEKRFWADSQKEILLDPQQLVQLEVVVDPLDVGCISDFVRPFTTQLWFEKI
jgi:mannosyl-glycoprotein endo-beta-N-acetylglucosaminidase